MKFYLFSLFKFAIQCNIQHKSKMHTMCKKFSLSNMGEQALKSHAAGKKHITVVTQTQKIDSVPGFFTVKCGTIPGASSSASLREASTPLACDTEDTKIQEVWQHIGILCQILGYTICMHVYRWVLLKLYSS